MIALPNECFFKIFNNLWTDNKSLFSCLFVNREWCRIIVPILWNEPNFRFRNIKLIKVLLLSLNVEEQALLIPFKINLPNFPKPLFEYTNYVTSVDFYLYDGIRNWLFHHRYKVGSELEYGVKCSLIALLLRTSNRSVSKDPLPKYDSDFFTP
ncbi:f-box domain-containing protein [Gigaspora margarita]|uniref:F-box domain-containing protein n=1 Tax=Gigaspora margarita TaxID=4874 RepID=A0A8H4AUK7_GIGMA|nr:f-box domain-containing protein [Gigaspora margarita]